MRHLYLNIDQGFIDQFPGSPTGPSANQMEPWSADVELSQLLYAGGRVRAALLAIDPQVRVALNGLTAKVSLVVERQLRRSGRGRAAIQSNLTSLAALAEIGREEREKQLGPGGASG